MAYILPSGHQERITDTLEDWGAYLEEELLERTSGTSLQLQEQGPGTILLVDGQPSEAAEAALLDLCPQGLTRATALAAIAMHQAKAA